jgi:hypothetical protein
MEHFGGEDVMLFFSGDLNYRLSCGREHAYSLLHGQDICNVHPDAARMLQGLLLYDELLLQRKTDSAFGGFNEACINFYPTFKFDVGSNVYVVLSFFGRNSSCPSTYLLVLRDLSLFVSKRRIRRNVICRYDTSKKQRTPSWTDRILWREPRAEKPTTRVVPCSYWSSPLETSSDHRPVGASFWLQMPASAAPNESRAPFTPILITNPGMEQLASHAAVAVASNVTWAVGAVSGAVLSNFRRASVGLSEAFVPGSTADTTIAAFTCKPAGNIFSEGRPGALAVMQHEVQFTSIGGKPYSIPYAQMKEITAGTHWRNGIIIHHSLDAAPLQLNDFNLLGLGKFSGNQRRHAVRLIKEQAAKLGVELSADAKLLE